MKTTLGLKNFRIFDNKGAEVHINPLTVLTGCNSSGKSSIVKALILLNEFLKGVRESAHGAEPRLEFDRKPLSLLGNFDSIVNKNAKDGKLITLSYTIDSLYLGKGTTVELTFGTQDNDVRKDGFLKYVAIKDADGNLLYHGLGYQGIKRFFPKPSSPFEKPDLWGFFSRYGKSSGRTVTPLKSRYFAYCLISRTLERYHDADSDNKLTGNTTDKEMEDMAKDASSFFREMARQTDKDLVFHAVDCFSKKRHSDLQKLFDIDKACIEIARRVDIISYLPILEELDSISKADFETEFRNMCAVGGQNPDGFSIDYLEDLVNRIISEFTCGDYRVFSDYYRNVENRFLEKGTMMVKSDGAMGRQLAIPDWEIYKTLSDSFKPVLEEDLSEDSPAGKESEAGIQPMPVKEPEETSSDSRDTVSLEQLFYLLTSIKNRPRDDDYVVHYKDGWTGIESRDHKILRDYMAFRKCALKDVFTIDPCDNLRYVGSNRIEIRRLYTLENQENFGRTVSEYFEARRLKKDKKIILSAVSDDTLEYHPGDFINKWIRNFGIGQRFSIESLPDGIGLVLKIYQSADDSEGRLLADYGYGISQLISVLLEIETAILKTEQHLGSKVVDYEEQTITLSNLFLMSEICSSPVSIAIEEPEIHLHPRYQSLLADMFVDAYQNFGIHFIVETHSEYLIRKLQNLVARGSIKPDALSFLYVEDGNDSDEKVREIGIAEDGRLTSAFGPGFFDEADSLAMNLLKIKGGLL